jgi:pimeloyl-ACP methyl ester carboxylesterase
VVYDRGGTGWSEPVTLPRSAGEVVGELARLLRAAELPGPYVLVGHSLGGVYARRYAQLFPDEVAAMLLLDPGHEDLYSYLPAPAAELSAQMGQAAEQLPELTDEQVRAARAAYARLYAQWPDEVLQPLVDHHLASWRTSLDESRNLDTDVYDELRRGGPVPDVPLIVLTAMGRNPHWERFASERLVREAQEGIRALHAAIAGSVSRGEHRVLDDAPHGLMHLERPDDVFRAIRDLLDWSGTRR